MAFCGECGSRLNDSSKFCSICGAPVPIRDKNNNVQGPFIPTENQSNNLQGGGVQSSVTNDVNETVNLQGGEMQGSVTNDVNKTIDIATSDAQQMHDTLSQDTRKEVFSGVIHKCPNCGTVLDGYVVTCPGCGFELRAEDSLASVKDLSRKLEMLELQRQNSTDKTSQKASLKKAFFGDPQVDALYAAKATTIMNYPIPNTKEEILEFVVLASSNINVEMIAGGVNVDNKPLLVEQNAWVSKMEQAYNKAQLSFPTDPTFHLVKQIYETKTNEINKTKTKSSRDQVLLIASIFLILGVFLVGCFVLLEYFSRNEKKEKEKEIRRLEAIVDEIEEDIADGDYSAAKRKAQRLHYDGPDDYVNDDEKGSLEKCWDETREGYVEEIEKLEKEAES